MNKAYLLEKLDHRIQLALKDKTIGEMSLNSDGKLWFTDHHTHSFYVGEYDSVSANGFVYALAQFNNQYLNEKNPNLDATLPFNGERISVRVPPITENVSFNIRKNANKVYTLDDYVDLDILTNLQADILTIAIRKRKNILVSGSPASGKTTLTNALLDTMTIEMPEGHRVLILEQVRELQCRSMNKESFVTTDDHNMNTLLWMAMRSSPDCLVVGEVRDGAALDLLKAWNTGCHGGVATIHANHAKAAIQRLLDLACEVVVTPPYALVAEAVDIIVHIEANTQNRARQQARISSRKVTEIIEVKSFDPNNKTYEFERLD